MNQIKQSQTKEMKPWLCCTPRKIDLGVHILMFPMEFEFWCGPHFAGIGVR